MFWLLFLAHLLGDYPFQPSWMVERKHHAWVQWLHGIIHFLFMFVLVGTSRLQLLPQLLALTLAHIILDTIKTSTSMRQSLPLAASYLLDQIMHILLIALTASWIQAILPAELMPQSWGWAVILTGYVFVTYAWGTTERLLTEDRTQYNHEVISQFYPRMIARAALFTLGLFLLQRQLMWTILAAINLPYISGEYRGRALFTDITVTLLTTITVILTIR